MKVSLEPVHDLRQCSAWLAPLDVQCPSTDVSLVAYVNAYPVLWHRGGWTGYHACPLHEGELLAACQAVGLEHRVYGRRELLAAEVMEEDGPAGPLCRWDPGRPHPLTRDGVPVLVPSGTYSLREDP